MARTEATTMARGPRTGTPFQVYLPPGMKELLTELATRNVRKLSAEVVIALQAHLEKNGLPYKQSTPPAADEPTPKKSTKKKGK